MPYASKVRGRRSVPLAGSFPAEPRPVLPPPPTFIAGRHHRHDPHPDRRLHQRHRHGVRLPDPAHDRPRLGRHARLPGPGQARVRHVLGQRRVGAGDGRQARGLEPIVGHQAERHERPAGHPGCVPAGSRSRTLALFRLCAETDTPPPCVRPRRPVYTCGGQDGTTPRKASQGGGFVGQDSCMVIEMEGVIDAINHPECVLSRALPPP